MFINDLPDYILDGEVFLFADDTSIIISSPDGQELNRKVNNVLTQFDTYCHKNRLIINYSKTIAIEFHKQSRSKIIKHNFKIDNNPIALRNHCKFLGINVDEQLNWNEHINSICSKLNKQYFALVNLKTALDKEGLLSAYYALIYSVISYNIVVYGLAAESTRIFLAQKRIIRLMFNLGYRESCRQTFKNEKILTFIGIYLLKLLIYIYLNREQFKKNSDIHSYPTRKNEDIRLGTFTYTSYRKSPQYMGCYLYNMLPPQIKNATDLNRFKFLLKTFLYQNTFYTIEEYINTVQGT